MMQNESKSKIYGYGLTISILYTFIPGTAHLITLVCYVTTLIISDLEELIEEL